MHLHVRTCTPVFHISQTAGRIAFELGVRLATHWIRGLHKSDVGCICTCARARPFRTMVPPRPLVHRRSRRHTSMYYKECLPFYRFICLMGFYLGDNKEKGHGSILCEIDKRSRRLIVNLHIIGTNPFCDRAWSMDKTVWRSDVSRAPGAGALDMASVQKVVCSDQTRLQKGVLMRSNVIIPQCTL